MAAWDADSVRGTLRARNNRAQTGETDGNARARPHELHSDATDVDVPIRVPLNLESGGTLPDTKIRVRSVGCRGAPAVLVMGGISSGRNLCGSGGWWNHIVREQGPVDLARHCVLSIDFAPNEDARVVISPCTQARLVALALDELGIERLPALIGASYGGMVGLSFATLFPERLGSLCVVSAAHKPAPLAMAWRGVQRRIVEFGLENGRGSDGLALARQLAMVTYRSPTEFQERFVCFLGNDGKSDLDRYLISRGNAYRDHIGPKRWLSLSEAIDRAQVSPEAIRTATTLVACPTDQLVPFADMEELARRLPRLVDLQVLPSPFGHDAFLKEPERLGEIIRTFLRGATS